MEDSKNGETPKNVEETMKDEKKTEIPESSGSYGQFGSSWLSQGSRWGASFLNSAKEKTMNTLDLVKKDLTDLSEAVTAEVNDLASAAKEGFGTAANAVKQQAQILEKLVTPTDEENTLPGEGAEGETPKEERNESGINFGWMTKIVDSVADTVKNLGMEETTNGEEKFTEVIKPKQTRKTILPQIRLNEIQKSDSTYTEEPEKSEFYETWVSRFNIDEYVGEIKFLLGNNPQLRQKFAELVPAIINHDTFWKRYFYAIEVAEAEEDLNSKTLSDALNVDVSPKKSRKTAQDDSKKSSPSSEESAVVVEEPTSPSQSEWSVCSEKNVEELPSNDEEETTGPLTPKPADDGNKKENKEDGWVDWEE